MAVAVAVAQWPAEEEEAVQAVLPFDPVLSATTGTDRKR